MIKKAPEITYCEECRYCRPWKEIFTFWGLWRRPALRWARCGHPNAEMESSESKDFRFIVRGTRYARDIDNLFCSTKNRDGHCPDFEPAVRSLLRPQDSTAGTQGGQL